jgi:hypothetical protein
MFLVLKYDEYLAFSRVRPNSTNFTLALQFTYVFLHHLYVPHESPDDGPSGSKHLVSGIIKIFVSVTVNLCFYL